MILENNSTTFVMTNCFFIFINSNHNAEKRKNHENNAEILFVGKCTAFAENVRFFS